METKEFKSIAEILYLRGEIERDKTAIIFLQSKEKEEKVTYGELSNRAKAIALELKQKLDFGDRVLLLYPPGIEYISAFFGCLYAGVIPVPAYPPDSRNTERLLMIIKDSQSKYALSTSGIMNYVDSLSEATIVNDDRREGVECLSQIGWIATDLIVSSPNIEYVPEKVKPTDIVFLQYTSGSTGNPKGVILNNTNLLDNLKAIRDALGCYSGTHMVSWLPPYHDMGLIGGILQPLYSGIGLTSMAPMTFLRNPFLWLDQISKRKEQGGVISGAPDFAYQLCVRKISEEKLASLDLSNWKVAYSGAEPVKESTLIDFFQKFKVSNFKMSTFLPVYGLAEATLLVSSGEKTKEPFTINIDKEALKNQKVQVITKENTNKISFVSCGSKEEGHEIHIVNPETCTLSKDGEIGEIWIKSPSVAVGYWQNEKLTQEVFNSYIQDVNEEGFFRTGDLGFMIDQNLYISGRHKDLIIIRGKNYYPQDIEHTVQTAHESLRPGCGSAFAIESEDGGESLIIVQEVKREFRRKIDIEEVTNAIYLAVSREYQIQVKDVVLIEPSSFPKTTSGKLQRLASKELYLKNNLQPIKAYLVC
ncbi:fatty acyl-AMP ligase [Aquimarina algiphila]|uniref:fatty acyl-AMP ligase n=1 Tax=Aquimarina algiphila TaxID=2047982 RepID=UPI002491D5AF|nr:fatty acyl-AMP ligase [Aquimarina algiphila]